MAQQCEVKASNFLLFTWTKTRQLQYFTQAQCVHSLESFHVGRVEFQLHELHCIQGRVRNNVSKAAQVTAEEALGANKILEDLLKGNQQGDLSVL